MLRRTFIALSALALGGCQTIGPVWSELTGVRYHVAIADRAPISIVRVDDRGAFGQYPIKIAPGPHQIVVQSLQHGRFAGGWEQTMHLEIAPCRRYYLNAQFQDPVQPRFTAVIDEVEPIAGCGRS